MSELSGGTPQQQGPLEGLFKKYGELAITYGKIEDKPRDPNLPPGQDGTVDPEGRRQRPFSIHVDRVHLPTPFVDHRIDDLEIRHSPRVVLDGLPTSETVTFSVHKADPPGTQGQDIFYELQRSPDSDMVTSDVVISLSEEPDERYETLYPGERDEIALDVLRGDTAIIEEEGDRGDFGRAVHGVLFELRREMDPAEIALFEQAYPYLEYDLKNR